MAIKKHLILALFSLAIVLAGTTPHHQAAAAEPVTIDTFVRAETDTAIRTVYDGMGFGAFFHIRALTPLDNQTVIRMNRDTLYSAAVLDLSAPVTVTLPDAGDRYMSLHVINQDHYMFVITGPGEHVLTQEMVGSRYAAANVRTFVNPGDPEDVAAANAAQDGLKIAGGGNGPLDIPDWDQEQLKTAREALNQLATLGMDTSRAFGTPEDTDPIYHLVGAAVGWGGLPRKSAFYEIRSVAKNDGSPHAVTVKDVPIDAFWSLTVYNADGFIDENELGAYSFNNVTARPNDDGSFTIHFGDCEDGRVNCLPISEGWNYAARMYEPREEILNKSWVFPIPEPVSLQAATAVTPEEARAIAKDAYIYGFPMVVHYKVMNAYVLDGNSPEYKAPFNDIGCTARAYTPEDRAIVTPNSDTPYCFGFHDLRPEPLVLRTPEFEDERFYHVQLIDLFTHNFAYIGTFETGNAAGNYLLVGPNWDGAAPEGIDKVIESETDIVFTTIRTQLFGSDDLQRVAELQSGYEFVPLSVYMGGNAKPSPVLQNPPEWVEGAQFDARAFEYIDYMLNLVEPIEVEKPIRKRFAKIDLGTGASFDLDEMSPDLREALEQGVAEGFDEIQAIIVEKSNDPEFIVSVFGTRGYLTERAKALGYDSYYLLRAAAAQAGLYGNSATEAMYPTYFTDAEGKPLSAAENVYTVTFAPGGLPPVKAFWSLTMYDGPTQLLVDNSIDRYLLNSTMMERFVYGEDGSLTLYVQAESPGPELEPNWLPAPAGPFYAVLRLYGPEEAALQGEWSPPPLERRE